MRIETERLIIREFIKKDLNRLHEILSDPTVMEYVEEPFDRADTKEYLDGYCIEEKSGFAITRKADGNLIGLMQFPQFDDESELVHQIGWALHKDFWRQGFAYEAASAVISYGFRTLGLHRIFASTTDDLKSAGLLKKLGFVQEGCLRKHEMCNNSEVWRDRLYFGILRKEYFSNETK